MLRSASDVLTTIAAEAAEAAPGGAHAERTNRPPTRPARLMAEAEVTFRRTSSSCSLVGLSREWRV